MDPILSTLAQFGFGGAKVAIVVRYTNFLAMNVLPRQHEAHICDLKAAHERCEATLAQVSSEFRQVLREQSKQNADAMERMAVSHEKLGEALTKFITEFKR